MTSPHENENAISEENVAVEATRPTFDTTDDYDQQSFAFGDDDSGLPCGLVGNLDESNRERNGGIAQSTATGRKKRKNHEAILEQSRKWIREMEVIRDDLYCDSVQNAILLEFLAMHGLDDPPTRPGAPASTAMALASKAIYPPKEGNNV